MSRRSHGPRIAVSLLLSLVAGAAGATPINVPGDYSTIQAAINGAAPGATIIVAAGTYAERLVITKPLTLEGAQVGVDPTVPLARTTPAAETIVTEAPLPNINPNVLIEIPAGVSGVTIDGFTLIGDPTDGNADTSVVRCWGSSAAIRNNIMDGRFPVLIKGGSYQSAEHNRITANKAGVTLQPLAADHLSIAGNLIVPGATPASDAQGIYLAGTTDSTVADNVISGFVNSNAIGGSGHLRLTLSGNHIDAVRKGINIWGATSFVWVLDNTVTNCLRGIEVKGADLTLTGNVVTNASEAGIVVDRHVIATERVALDDNTITGGPASGDIGLLLLNVTSGPDINLGTTAFQGDLDWFIRLANSAGASRTSVNVNAKQADFGGATLAQIEAKIHDQIDDALLGLVLLNQAPTAVALVNGAESVTVEQATHAGTEVTLDGSGSSDPDGDALTYAWDFETDGTVDSTEAVVSHTYNLGGPYTATLTVTDPASASSSDTVTVTVEDTTPPTVAIDSPADGSTQYNTDGPVLVTVTVTDACDSAPALALTLDGEPFSGTEIDVADLDLGEHTLAATATDASGNEGSGSSTFTVAARPLGSFCVRELKIEWRDGGGKCGPKQDRVKIKGDFSLPSGYALSDLSGTGTLILEIGGQAVSAEVVGKSTGRGHGKWSRRFGRCRDGGRLWFTSDRSSRRGGDLKFEGEIEADLVNDNTGLVTVTLVLPVTAGGDLAGSETVTCRTKRNEWEYKAHCDRPCAITGGAVTSLSAAPTTTGAQIVFTLSGDADVSATILNIAGRPVRTLATDRAVTAGVNVLLWNGLSDAGLRAPAGAYLVRVTAHAGDGGSSSSVALLGLGR